MQLAVSSSSKAARPIMQRISSNELAIGPPGARARLRLRWRRALANRRRGALRDHGVSLVALCSRRSATASATTLPRSASVALACRTSWIRARRHPASKSYRSGRSKGVAGFSPTAFRRIGFSGSPPPARARAASAIVSHGLRLLLRLVQIAHDLHVEPHLDRSAEHFRQAKCGTRRHAPATVRDGAVAHAVEAKGLGNSCCVSPPSGMRYSSSKISPG